MQFKGEKKYADVVDILACLEATFEDIFQAANEGGVAREALFQLTSIVHQVVTN